MKRLINALRGILLTLLFGLGLLATWLINTEAGLHWTIEQARGFIPGELSLEQLEGRLSGPITAASLQYQHPDGLALSLDALKLDWSPSALLVGQLRFREVSARGLRLTLPPADQDASQAAPPLALPDISLPINLALARLEVTDIQVQPPGQAAVHIDRVSLGASLHWDRLKISRLSLSAEQGEVKLQGRATLSETYAHQLKFDWRLSQTPLGAARGQGSLEGDLHQTRLSHQLSQPVTARAELTLHQLLTQPRGEGQIDIERFALQTLRPDLPQGTVSLSTHVQGDLQQLALDGSFHSDTESLSRLMGDYRLQLSPAGVQVDLLKVSSPDGQRGAELRGQWALGEDGGAGELALSWQGLAWPLQGEPQVSSAQGSAYVRGAPQEYRFSLAGDLDSPHWQASHLRAIGRGTLGGMEIDLARLLTLDGEITGPVRLDWSQTFAWQARLQAKGLNPGQRWPDWPGKLAFELDSRGDLHDGLSTQLDLARLEGELRQYPVRLEGRLAWSDQTLALRQLRLQTAGAQARADGRLGRDTALDWQLDAEDLAPLYPGLAGSLQAAGTLRGELATPLLRFSLQGQALAWRDYELGSIEAEGEADLMRWQQLALDAHGEALQVAGQSLEAFSIDLRQQQQRQTLVLGLEHSAAAVQLEAEGETAQTRWQGQLSNLHIQTRDFGDWVQRRPTELRFAPQQLELELDQFCLDSQQGQACARIDYRPQDPSRPRMNAQLEARELPLALLAPLFKPATALSGRADLSLRTHLDEQRRLLGEGQLTLGAGSVDIRMPDNEIEQWNYQRGEAKFSLDSQGLTSQAELIISDTEALRVEASLPGLDALRLDTQTQPLRASATLTLNQLGLLQGLVYEARNLRGDIKLDAQASGTLAAPSLSGRLSLSEGAMDLPRLGIGVRNITLSAEGDDRRVTYRLEADSGDGRLQASGHTELRPEAGWPTRIEIKGDELRVANIPEARIDASPDLRISLAQRRIEVNGRVDIPYAKLQPKDLSSAALPSEDVRFKDAPAAAEEDWQIFSTVRLVLSERIFLNAYGFEGRITGDVVLKDEPGKPPTGIGELSVVEGRYSAYGQRLQVERGQLLFASSPLNNPGLDLRAVRQVQQVTVGFTVTGTLRNPRFDLFSTPAMSQTDALAYLLLGRPLEEGAEGDGSLVAQAALALGLKGGDFLARKIGDRFGLDEVRVEASDSGDQASLFMGRYLSPQLYISYGVGLIESVNTLKLRYEISRRWQLVAESGEELSADLLYTIETGD